MAAAPAAYVGTAHFLNLRHTQNKSKQIHTPQEKRVNRQQASTKESLWTYFVSASKFIFILIHSAITLHCLFNNVFQ